MAASARGRFGITVILFRALYTKISLLFNCVRKRIISVGEKFFCFDLIKVQLFLSDRFGLEPTCCAIRCN